MDGPDILAATSPRALFGDAVDEPRSLKRAYAKLIRAFGPDDHPEVFAHIRGLYESARNGDLDGLSNVISLSPQTPAPADPTPAERLEQAMKEGYADLAIDLLSVHDLELRITSPNTWFAAVAALADARTFALPSDLMQSWLDGIDTPPVGIPDELLDRIELLTSVGIAYQAARLDPRIDPAVLDLIGRWGASPVHTAEAFMEAQEALPDPEFTWKAFAAIKVYYPGLWYPLTLMVNTVTHEVEAFDEQNSTWIGKPIPKGLRETPEIHRFTKNWKFWSLLSIGFFVSSSFKVFPDMDWFAKLLVVLVVAWVLLAAKAASIVDPYKGSVDKALQYGREWALFPSEVLDAMLPADGVERGRYDDKLRWQKDPTLLMRILTPAHLNRIRARTGSP